MARRSNTMFMPLSYEPGAVCHNMRRHLGLAIEAAELQELFLWKSADEVDALLASEKGRQRLEAELADTFIFVLYLSQRCHVDFTQALRRQLALNRQKNPVDKN